MYCDSFVKSIFLPDIIGGLIFHYDDGTCNQLFHAGSGIWVGLNVERLHAIPTDYRLIFFLQVGG